MTQVIQKDVPIYVELVGQTRGSKDIEIWARVEGWVEEIHFGEGTEVEKGTLLYTIDDNTLGERIGNLWLVENGPRPGEPHRPGGLREASLKYI